MAETYVTISIQRDSAVVLAKAYSNVYNGKSRHIGLQHSYVRQLIIDSVITMEFIRTFQNLDDPLTKGFARDLVSKTAKRMVLKSTSKITHGGNSTWHSMALWFAST